MNSKELRDERHYLLQENQRIKRILQATEDELYESKLENKLLQKKNHILYEDNLKLQEKLDKKEQELNEIKLEKNDLKTMTNDLQKPNQQYGIVYKYFETKTCNTKDDKEAATNYLYKTKTEGYVYVATTKAYASKYLFKIGSTCNLKRRLADLNTGRISKDPLYYCYYKQVSDMKYTEKTIHDVLQDFRDSQHREFFRLPFAYIKKHIESICHRINQGYERFSVLNHNDEIDRLFSLRAIQPPILEIERNGGLPEYELTDEIAHLLRSYIKDGRSVVNRKDLFDDLDEKLGINIDRPNTWKLFKQQFNWISSKDPIYLGKHKITIKY